MKNYTVNREGDVIKVGKVGSSGTENYSGYIQEEYLNALLHPYQFAKLYDEMRRSDGAIKKIILAMIVPMVSAVWEIGAEDDNDPNLKEKADNISKLFFDSFEDGWSQKLEEILSVFWCGVSVFEKTYTVKKVGDEYLIGLGDFGYVNQKTLKGWHLDECDRLEFVEQEGYGDSQKQVLVPAQYCVIFNIGREGNNFNGISPLRSVYGNYIRKKRVLNKYITAHDRYMISTPILKEPMSRPSPQERYKAEEAMELYTSGKQKYVILPNGWELNFEDTKYDPSKSWSALKEENAEITFSVLANFLELTGGSFALAKDLSEFFENSIKFYANLVRDKLNNSVIEELVRFNYGEEYVGKIKLSYFGIEDKISEEFGNLMGGLVTSNLITPDEDIEKMIRKRLGFPALRIDAVKPFEEELEVEEVKKIENGQAVSKQTFANAKSGNQRIKNASKELRGITERELAHATKSVIKDYIKSFNDGKVPTGTKEKLAKKIKPIIAKELRKIAGNESDALRSEYSKDLKSSKKARLFNAPRKEVESLDSLIISSENNEIDGEQDRAPARIRERINRRATVLVETVSSGLDSTLQNVFARETIDRGVDSVTALNASLEKGAVNFLTGTTLVASVANTVSASVNFTRNEFFKDIEDQVLSYSYVNPDPQAKICKKMSGKTLIKGHGELATLIPPFHHNCETIMVANTVSMRNVPTPQTNKVSLTEEEIRSAIFL